MRDSEVVNENESDRFQSNNSSGHMSNMESRKEEFTVLAPIPSYQHTKIGDSFQTAHPDNELTTVDQTTRKYINYNHLEPVYANQASHSKEK